MATKTRSKINIADPSIGCAIKLEPLSDCDMDTETRTIPTKAGKRPVSKCEGDEKRAERTSRNNSIKKQRKKRAKNEKFFKCAECDTLFCNYKNLKRHKGIHSGVKPYSCKICSASFRIPFGLESHMKVHSASRPFACPHCTGTFKHASNLRRHVRTHTGERPYVCEQCGAAFKCSSSLREHSKVHSNNRPFVCDECGATFKHLTSLMKHLRVNNHTQQKNNKVKETLTARPGETDDVPSKTNGLLRSSSKLDNKFRPIPGKGKFMYVDVSEHFSSMDTDEDVGSSPFTDRDASVLELEANSESGSDMSDIIKKEPLSSSLIH